MMGGWTSCVGGGGFVVFGAMGTSDRLRVHGKETTGYGRNTGGTPESTSTGEIIRDHHSHSGYAPSIPSTLFWAAERSAG